MNEKRKEKTIQKGTCNNNFYHNTRVNNSNIPLDICN